MSEQPLNIAEYISANQQLARELVEARDEVEYIAGSRAGWKLHAEELEAEVVRLSADLADARRRIDAAFADHHNMGGYCDRCTQDEEQPQPVGWWIPWPCPTVRALSAGGGGTAEGGGDE